MIIEILVTLFINDGMAHDHYKQADYSAMVDKAFAVDIAITLRI